MPYSPKQHRLFEGIKHGSIPEKDGLTKEKASTLASEGVKKKPKHERMYERSDAPKDKDNK